MAEVTKFEIKGLDKLLKKFGGLQNVVVRRQFERTMFRTTEMIKNQARSLVPVDTGALRRSIRNVIRVGDKEILGIVGPTEPYGAAVEFGTKPHPVPVKAIERWARKRGLNPYAVAMSIRKKGTKPHPYLIPAFQRLQRRVVEEFNRAIEYLLNL